MSLCQLDIAKNSSCTKLKFIRNIHNRLLATQLLKQVFVMSLLYSTNLTSVLYLQGKLASSSATSVEIKRLWLIGIFILSALNEQFLLGLQKKRSKLDELKPGLKLIF